MNNLIETETLTARRVDTFRAAYKDIMVHLDGSAEDDVRLAHAEAIAVRFGAHLTGLYANVLPNNAIYEGEYGGSAIVELLEFARGEGEATTKRLVDRFARLDVENEVRRIENFSDLVWSDVAREARLADLFVASCPYGKPSDGRWSPLIETIMFESGHGIYLIPRDLKPRRTIETVLVGWVNTRESARAVAESLPMLGLATKVELVSIHVPGNGQMGGAEVLADIATHLDRHGIATTLNVLPAIDTVATALLDEAHQISADLIVTGAYGHSRLREWILGGTTRDLISKSDLPILMAH